MVHAPWIVMSTLVLVPVAMASLRGWTPRWLPAMSTRVTKARGMAAFVIYGESQTPALLSLAEAAADELLLLRSQRFRGYGCGFHGPRFLAGQSSSRAPMTAVCRA
jgi:hypothetical protein